MTNVTYKKTSRTDYATWQYYAVSVIGVDLTVRVKSKHQNSMSHVAITTDDFETIDRWNRNVLPEVFGTEHVEAFLSDNQERIVGRLEILGIAH